MKALTLLRGRPVSGSIFPKIMVFSCKDHLLLPIVKGVGGFLGFLPIIHNETINAWSVRTGRTGAEARIPDAPGRDFVEPKQRAGTD